MRVVLSECKIDQADFTYWMSFLPSDLMKEIIPNPGAQSAMFKVFHQHGIAEKTKIILAYLFRYSQFGWHIYIGNKYT